LTVGEASGEDTRLNFQLTSDGFKFNPFAAGSQYRVPRRNDAQVVDLLKNGMPTIAQKVGVFGLDETHTIEAGLEKLFVKKDGELGFVFLTRKGYVTDDQDSVTIKMGENGVDDWGGIWNFARKMEFDTYGFLRNEKGTTLNHLVGGDSGAETTVQGADKKFKIKWDWSKGNPEAYGYVVDPEGKVFQIGKYNQTNQGLGYSIELKGKGKFVIPRVVKDPQGSGSGGERPELIGTEQDFDYSNDNMPGNLSRLSLNMPNPVDGSLPEKEQTFNLNVYSEDLSSLGTTENFVGTSRTKWSTGVATKEIGYL